jgi:hypothetical protein
VKRSSVKCQRIAKGVNPFLSGGVWIGTRRIQGQGGLEPIEGWHALPLDSSRAYPYPSGKERISRISVWHPSPWYGPPHMHTRRIAHTTISSLFSWISFKKSSILNPRSSVASSVSKPKLQNACCGCGGIGVPVSPTPRSPS